MNRLATALRAIGPYAAIELLLPGGSLVALSLWGIRNRAMLAERVKRAFGGEGLPVTPIEPQQERDQRPARQKKLDSGIGPDSANERRDTAHPESEASPNGRQSKVEGRNSFSPGGHFGSPA
jgi:hypothetical protein